MNKKILSLIITVLSIAVICSGCISSKNQSSITLEAAKSLALDKAGASEADVKFIEQRSEVDDGRQIYEIEFIYNNVVYSADINANDGSFIAWESEAYEISNPIPSNESLITEESAKEIALKNANLSEADVKGLRVKKDIEDGKTVYDIEFRQGMTEYSAEISALDGSVISWEVDK